MVATGSAAKTGTYLSSLHSIKTIASTVPPNGDVNPYGIAIVAHTVGALTAGDFLVSNFNAKSNNQGTGSTIVQISPAGKLSVFAHITAHSLPGACPGGVGLTGALGVLPRGYVVVGSLPTTNGQSATAKYGCLIVLNSAGHPVETITGPDVEGPWGMATVTKGTTTTLFVSNTLNGGANDGSYTEPTATVLRIRLTTSRGAPRVTSQQIIADAIPWRDDKAALVIGPTGVALASNDTLYVTDTLGNGIIAIPHAMTRTRALADRLHHARIGGRSEAATRADHRPEWRHHHHQRGRRQHRRDDTNRQAGCGRCRRCQIRRGLAVRAGDHAQQRPRLRGRRAQHPADAPLTQATWCRSLRGLHNVRVVRHERLLSDRRPAVRGAGPWRRCRTASPSALTLRAYDPKSG